LNLISYVLFGRGNPRYRDCVPIILSANAGLYQDFTTRLHVEEGLQDDPAVRLAAESSSRGARVEVRVVRRAHSGLEATCWRVMPLWDDRVDFLLCREIDSIPCGHEIRAVRAFMASGLAIHALRAHQNHCFRLMAGLVGFRRGPLLRHRIPANFDEYMMPGALSGWRHGCDQRMLAAAFGHLAAATLDTPIRGAPPSEPGVTTITKELLQSPPFPEPPDPQTLALCDQHMKFPGSTLMPSRRVVESFLALPTAGAQAVRESVAALGLNGAFGRDKPAAGGRS